MKQYLWNAEIESIVVPCHLFNWYHFGYNKYRKAFS